MNKYLFLILLAVCFITSSFILSTGHLRNKNNFRPTREQFKEYEFILTREEADELILKKKLGQSRENALVALVFNEDEELLTAEEYNNLFNNESKINKLDYKFTNLSVFYAVTGRQEANPYYTKLLPSANNTVVYVFDPFQKYYMTYEEESQKIIQLLDSLEKVQKIYADLNKNIPRYSYTTDVGDFFVNPSLFYPKNDKNASGLDIADPSYSASETGHAAGSITSTIRSTFYDFSDVVLVAEAQGYSLLEPSYIPTSFDEIIVQKMSRNWRDHRPSSKYTSVQLVPNVSYSVVSGMSVFWLMHASGSMTYSITATKFYVPLDVPDQNSPYPWSYCSLFLWQAMYNKTNRKIDVDYDGGYWCSPNDILNDGTNRTHFSLLFRLTNAGLN